MRSKQILFVIIIVILSYCAAEEKQKCGRRFIGRSLIIGGKNVSPNMYPWLVAFYHLPKKVFFCGGSLISEKHVLSAAHCFRNKRKKITTPAHEVTAFIGKHNLSNIDEPGIENPLLRVIIHPDWDSEDPRYDADISLAVLTNDVTFNDRIEPICLPQPSQGESSGNGTVIGWGRSEDPTKMFTTPNELDVPIVSNTQCIYGNKRFAVIMSYRTFCAGFVNQSRSVCDGDSGSGLVALDTKSGLYEIKGIVSSSLSNSLDCNTEVYSIYTNVANFVDWIEEKVKEGRGERGQLETYHCEKDKLTPTQKVKCRQENWSETDMENFDFLSNEIITDIGKKFDNLLTLSITFTSLKLVERRIFVNLKNLVTLRLDNNKIEFVPEDCFLDLQNLETLQLYRNNINRIPEKIFENMKEVRDINLSNNKIEILPKNLFKHNLKLVKINFSLNPIKTIDVDFTKLPKLSVIYLFNSSCVSYAIYSRDYIFDFQQQIDRNCTSSFNVDKIL